MQYPTKRRFQDTKTDMEFLICQTRVLSESEYKNKSLSQPYTKYLELFYKRRLSSVFSEFKNRVWFIDRYIDVNPVIQRSPASSPHFIVLESIDHSTPFLYIQEIFANKPDVLNIYIDQHNYSRKYTRDVYLNVKPGTDVDKLLESLDFFSKAYPFDFPNNKIQEYYQGTEENLRGILNELCKQDNLDYKTVFDEFIKKNDLENQENVINLVKILRNQFRYCTLCTRRYDNEVSMHRRCGSHGSMNPCSRNIEIAAFPKDLKNIEFDNGGSEIEKYYWKAPNSTFKCNVCMKLFEAEEFIKKHVSNKHADMVAQVSRKKESFEKFIKNIDYFALDIINGTECKSVPEHAEVGSEVGLPVYDFPRLFSGEIKFD